MRAGGGTNNGNVVEDDVEVLRTALEMGPHLGAHLRSGSRFKRPMRHAGFGGKYACLLALYDEFDSVVLGDDTLEDLIHNGRQNAEAAFGWVTRITFYMTRHRTISPFIVIHPKSAIHFRKFFRYRAIDYSKIDVHHLQICGAILLFTFQRHLRKKKLQELAEHRE